MPHFVPSPISIRFDFQNPDGWNAHARRDLIEALSAFVDEVSPSLRTTAATACHMNVDGDERVVRAHTPWVGEGETQIVLTPVIPPSVVTAAYAHEEKAYNEFAQTVTGRGLNWVLRKISKDDFERQQKETAQKIMALFALRVGCVSSS